jgi:hypothetical protein
MAQQAILNEVDRSTAKKTVRYSMGRNPVDVLMYALPIIRKYHPDAKVGPMDERIGREPKLVITDGEKKPIKFPIRDMNLEGFYNLLLARDVSGIDYSWFEEGDGCIGWDDNWILISYSEIKDTVTRFQITYEIGFEDFVVKKRPYIKIKVSPATPDNKNKLAQLAEELKRI